MNTLSISADSLKNETVVTKSLVPVYLYATVLCSLSIMIGLIWDISWHTSIGRDGLFSSPHLAIYFGGVVAGLFSGYRVLKMTFSPSLAETTNTVKFWGIFRGSLGNLFCIWGAIAMLTSAPFDDWWHNTYGLDVTILSPPHTVLLLGMIMSLVLLLACWPTRMRKDTLQKQHRILLPCCLPFPLVLCSP
jgi:hypothetical protein